MHSEELVESTAVETETGPMEAPISELGRALRLIRERYIEQGGSLLDVEEIERDKAERRGGVCRLEADNDLR